MIIDTSGEYKVLGVNKTPPALVVYLTAKAFKDVVSQIDREAFIKVRNVKGNYKEIKVNSFSDLQENEAGFPNWENCALNINIKISTLGKEIKERLDKSPSWWLIAKSKDKALSLMVDKQSEKVLTRKVIEI